MTVVVVVVDVVKAVDMVKVGDVVKGVEVAVLLNVREMDTLKTGATTCMVIRTKVLMLLNPLQTLSQRLIRKLQFLPMSIRSIYN